MLRKLDYFKCLSSNLCLGLTDATVSFILTKTAFNIFHSCIFFFLKKVVMVVVFFSFFTFQKKKLVKDRQGKKTMPISSYSAKTDAYLKAPGK